jgi:hypothetical protein
MSTQQTIDIKPPSIWVVFTGKADMPWLRFLKPGFRHCYAVMNDGHKWISIDPLSNYTDITIHHDVPADFDLPGWLIDRGHRVVPTNPQRPLKQAPWMVFTCVEAVKRMIGVHARFILTPWQLYKFLIQEKEHSNGKFNIQT